MPSTRRIEVLAALALLLVGCPEEPQGPRYRGAGGEPQTGGTFVFHHESNLDSLDPHLGYNELATMASRLIYDGLLDYDHDAELVPSLAEAMPTISDGGRRFRFRLRQGVRFHPMPGYPQGRELTTADVRYSLMRLMSPGIASPGFPFFRTIEGADAYHAGERDDVPGIRVIDRYTIEFQLIEPDQTFLNAMAMTFSYPLPHEAVEHFGDEFGRNPVGTGPNVFVRWERGVQVEFRRFAGYWNAGPSPSRLIFLENLQRGVAAMRFRNGDLDAIHRQNTQDFLFFRQADAWHPTTEEFPLPSTWGIIMNTEIAPFDDVHVRRAVAYGIDREAWVRARSSRINAAGQLVPPNVWGYAEDLENEHHMDLARAREELALAGYPDGLPEEIELLTGDGDVSRIYGELFQSDMARIGIRVRLKQLAFATFLQQSGTRRMVQAHLSGWNMDFPDAASFFDPLFHSRAIADESSQNRAFYSNPELDALLDRARAETDRAARLQMYREAATILNDDAPWAFVFNPMLMEVWQPYVKGYRPHPVWSEDYRQVWLDLPRQRITDRLGGAE